jgi:hypothetical protein
MLNSEEEKNFTFIFGGNIASCRTIFHSEKFSLNIAEVGIKMWGNCMLVGTLRTKQELLNYRRKNIK